MTAAVTLTLTATSPKTVKIDGKPLLPGMPSNDSVDVTGPGSASGPLDIVQPAATAPTLPPPTTTITWTLVPGTGWGASTQLAALVFGFCADTPSAIRPDQILQPLADDGPIRLDSFNTWALPAGTHPGTGFTFMTAPIEAADARVWSLKVVWANVRNTKLLQPPSGAGNSLYYLCTKFRCYFYTPDFGLWYVDPELDLCPQ